MHKHVLFFLNIFLFVLCLYSCDKDNGPDYPGYSNTGNNQTETPGHNNTGNNQSENADIAGIISQSVSVSSSYSDYTLTVTISSKLKSQLQNSGIWTNPKYGIGHAKSSYQSEISISFGSQAYYYNVVSKGDTETITIKNPFWFYYVFVDRDDDKWSMCEPYYNSYLALKSKGYSSLSSEEKDLYNEVTTYLNKCQSEARYNYYPTLYIDVNGKSYKIKEFHI